MAEVLKTSSGVAYKPSALASRRPQSATPLGSRKRSASFSNDEPDIIEVAVAQLSQQGEARWNRTGNSPRAPLARNCAWAAEPSTPGKGVSPWSSEPTSRKPTWEGSQASTSCNTENELSQSDAEDEHEHKEYMQKRQAKNDIRRCRRSATPRMDHGTSDGPQLLSLVGSAKLLQRRRAMSGDALASADAAVVKNVDMTVATCRPRMMQRSLPRESSCPEGLNCMKISCPASWDGTRGPLGRLDKLAAVGEPLDELQLMMAAGVSLADKIQQAFVKLRSSGLRGLLRFLWKSGRSSSLLHMCALMWWSKMLTRHPRLVFCATVGAAFSSSALIKPSETDRRISEGVTYCSISDGVDYCSNATD